MESESYAPGPGQRLRPVVVPASPRGRPQRGSRGGVPARGAVHATARPRVLEVDQVAAGVPSADEVGIGRVSFDAGENLYGQAVEGDYFADRLAVACKHMDACT
jgi:hypothetical protein